MKRKGLTSVRLRPEIAKMVEVLMDREGLTKAEIINEALRRFFLEREFERVREKLVPYARTKGILAEDDVDRVLG
ncbi:MAG: excisionase family protein [Candidatus Omnitrophica bacterium]|nr:excisionase family protein [Candidatus Omnitrophota bacterium]